MNIKTDLQKIAHELAFAAAGNISGSQQYHHMLGYMNQYLQQAEKRLECKIKLEKVKAK